MKTRLIDYLLAIRTDYRVLASEFQFNGGRSRADLLHIDGRMHAYEIKGDFDNLGKLKIQIKNYQTCFDAITVAVTAKHLDNANRIVPRSVGVILVENDLVLKVREPQPRKFLLKRELANIISSKDLIFCLKPYLAKTTGLTVTDLRHLAVRKLSRANLRRLAHESVVHRTLPAYENFLSQRGDVTHQDDLILLTSQPQRLI